MHNGRKIMQIWPAASIWLWEETLCVYCLALIKGNQKPSWQITSVVKVFIYLNKISESVNKFGQTKEVTALWKSMNNFYSSPTKVSTHYITWLFSFWIWRRCLKILHGFWPFGALPPGPHGGPHIPFEQFWIPYP